MGGPDKPVPDISIRQLQKCGVRLVMVVKERIPSRLELTMKAGQVLSPAGYGVTGLFPLRPLRGVFKSYS